ncbi:hypothetical protein EVAR_11440_1 [Eumeta japonica]|uniref:Uncharacterized protein n=1 Tax=Eumeta variegata TaxID=151549 RepID=A0A4C1TKW7_EUMVA|nr:hypothetical protein EVAR_11440_1 [Eumeta japonica]
MTAARGAGGAPVEWRPAGSQNKGGRSKNSPGLLSISTFNFYFGLPKSNPGILHDCRGRERMKASKQMNDDVSTPTAGASEAMHASG